MATQTKPQTFTKAQMIARWRALRPSQPLRPAAVPYKHEGSTYSEDGIRITGSQAWIDSVLSHLQPLLDFEADGTRLQVVYKETVDRETGTPTGTFNAYIQVHERGPQSAALNRAISAGGHPVKTRWAMLDLDGEERQVYLALVEQGESCHLDRIVGVTGLPVPKVQAAVVTLELKGRIQRLQGNAFVVREGAAQ